MFPCAEEAHCEALLEDAGAPIIASEEAHREPAESGSVFPERYSMSVYINYGKTTIFFDGASNLSPKIHEKIHN